MMIGSATAWVSASTLGHTISVTGFQIAGSTVVTGSLTFTAGVTLLVLGGLLLVSDAGAIRLLGILTALTSLGLAGYDLARIMHLISRAHSSASGLAPNGAALPGRLSVGFGLIMVLVAAVGAVLTSLAARR
jgi:hypothetical protein